VGSRSRNHEKGGARRIKRPTGAVLPYISGDDPHADRTRMGKYVKKVPGLTSREIARELDEPLAWVFNNLNELRHKGQVYYNGRWWPK
jgi:hypothetical protein